MNLALHMLSYAQFLHNNKQLCDTKHSMHYSHILPRYSILWPLCWSWLVLSILYFCNSILLHRNLKWNFECTALWTYIPAPVVWLVTLIYKGQSACYWAIDICTWLLHPTTKCANLAFLGAQLNTTYYGSLMTCLKEHIKHAKIETSVVAEWQNMFGRSNIR